MRERERERQRERGERERERERGESKHTDTKPTTWYPWRKSGTVVSAWNA